MLLEAAVRYARTILAGGPGSGCRGPNCGRPCLTPGCPEQQHVERQPVGHLSNTSPIRHAEVDIDFDRSETEKIKQRLNGLTPQQATAILLKGIPELNEVSVQFYTDESGGLAVSMLGHSGAAEFSLQRYFRGKGKKIVDHDHFDIDENAQGRGLGKALFRNMLDLYDHTGEESIGVTANKDVGGYAWARYGFVPDKSSWRDWKEDAWSRLDDIQNATVSAEVDRLLHSDDPRSMQKIADITAPIGTPGKRSVPIEVDLSMPAGKYMLMKTNWDGTLDLTDPEQYSRARIYTSGSKEKKQAA